MSDPADEPVEVSYYQRWLVGTRMSGRSMPHFTGHAMQAYHWDVLTEMKARRSPVGFMRTVHVGPAAERPAASDANLAQLWINDDAGGPPKAGEVLY